MNPIVFRPLSPFGAEVDLDLSRSLDAAVEQALVEAFQHHDLLVFRHQALSHERQIEIAGLLGPVVRTDDNVGFISNVDADDRSASREYSFHSDYSFAPSPLLALSLHAIDLVDGASSTRFISAVRALERLPDDVRQALLACEADMVAPVPGMLDAIACEIETGRFPLHERRPTVQTDERSGRHYLLINQQHTAAVFDKAGARRRDLLDRSFAALYADDNEYEHVWHRGDFVLWNNRTLQHARGDLSSVGRRVLQRVGVGLNLIDQYPDLARRYFETN